MPSSFNCNILENTIVKSDSVLLPENFTLMAEGLYYDKDKVCSPIEVLAYTRDENNENWGRLIRFKDPDGYNHEIAIPMELLSGDCSSLYALLLSLGLTINTKNSIRIRLPEYLQNIKLDNRKTCVSRIGWHNSHFILPGTNIPDTGEYSLQSENNNFIGFRTKGTLQEWQEYIAKPCQGNSRLVFALSGAFAAPLLTVINAESGGFNLKGASSIGKSTALACAASVWGSPKYIQSWKATGNALEAVAEAHNDALLCLDELGQVDGKEAGEIAYMLANGSGKNRLKSKGGLRKKHIWKNLSLSTGEVSIADKLNEAGKKVQAGMTTRMVDIPADAGKGHRLFDTIHSFNDGNELANHLKENVTKYYGTPIRTFLSFIVTVKDRLQDGIKQIEADFFEKYVPKEADGQVRRVASRFVLVAAGGELAINSKVLPYELGEAIEAAGICFLAWLDSRGSSDAYETEEAIAQVKAFFEANYSSRFATMSKDSSNEEDEKIYNQAGFKRKTNNGSYEFFVYPEIFRKEIAKGFDCKIVCALLEKKGLLIRGSDKKQYVKSQWLPIGRKKIYHISSAILSDGNDEGGN